MSPLIQLFLIIKIYAHLVYNIFVSITINRPLTLLIMKITEGMVQASVLHTQTERTQGRF
ncbi:MAG: hypothetical protein APR56_00675 [Methanosaeta sp. SDB]|nr:MAG: hypothetical protein APR56_00675 [Methanosaeta sp. SDB]